MWLRCRNSMSGHEASIPVDLVPALPAWTPLKEAKPSMTFASPEYSTEPPAQDRPTLSRHRPASPDSKE